MSDTLTLGGIAFDGFSTPTAMGAGGKQAMVIHKLPGGSRVIDTLGPDEENITWQGEFFGNNAYANALLLDGMRASGQMLVLTFGGQSRNVILESFTYHIRRLPVWVEYNISCAIYQNASLGNTSPSTGSIDSMVGSDLSTAASAGSPADQLAAGTTPL